MVAGVDHLARVVLELLDRDRRELVPTAESNRDSLRVFLVLPNHGEIRDLSLLGGSDARPEGGVAIV